MFLYAFQGKACAGAICSALGSEAVYLYGATSNLGTRTYGSYLVHWRMLEWVKEQGCRNYDLDGINAELNPGGYQFKTQLAGANGREVNCFGEYEVFPSAIARICLRFSESLRPALRRLSAAGRVRFGSR